MPCGRWLDRFTTRRYALGAIAVSALLAVERTRRQPCISRSATSTRVRRSFARDSRYNRDNAYITAHYALSCDQFAVIVKTEKEGCLKYQTLVEADRLAWALRQVPGVQTTVSLADAVRQITAGSFEGNPKWLTINRNQDVLNYAAQQASVNNPDLFNTECSVMPVIAYLADHKAETLDRVVDAAAGVRGQARRQGSRGSCSRPAAPASRLRPISSSSRRTARCCSTFTPR